EPTRDAEELRLIATIGPLAVPTPRTGLAGIGWVHVDDPHASQRCLVGNEGAQLPERPIVQHSPLALRNRLLRAFADMREVFQRNPTRSAFRRAHNGLADAVVDVSAESLFPAATRPQPPRGGLRALLLQLLPEAAVARSHLIDMRVLG